MNVTIRVNGEATALELEPNELLLDVLRERLGLLAAKRSCDVQVCGTCTVLLDGQPVSACCTLAVDAADRDVTTLEGLRETPEFARIERAFTDQIGAQCGYCTSGMVLTIASRLAAGEIGPGEDGARAAIEDNLCRCTGYRAIIDAVAELAER